MNAFMIESKYTPETRERLFREAHALCDRYTPVKRTRRILRQIERYSRDGVRHVKVAMDLVDEGRSLLANSTLTGCWDAEQRCRGHEILDILLGLIDLALSPEQGSCLHSCDSCDSWFLF